MKRLSIILCLVYMLAGNLHAQVEPKPTAAEEREAKNLAVSFFNRYQETQDLAPLIKEYFVKDFARRLKFCHTTGECGGTNRDFWGSSKKLVATSTTEMDSQRRYASTINVFFLYFRSIQYFNDNYPQKMNEGSWEPAVRNIENQLKSLLKDNPKLIKFNLFGSVDEGEEKKFSSKNSEERRQFLKDFEKFVAALKVVETKLRTDFLKKNPNAKTSFSLADFRIDIEENYNRFFDYPVGTRIIEVWCENNSLPFLMNLIEEDGKLKIVAIYPPMD